MFLHLNSKISNTSHQCPEVDTFNLRHVYSDLLLISSQVCKQVISSCVKWFVTGNLENYMIIVHGYFLTQDSDRYLKSNKLQNI